MTSIGGVIPYLATPLAADGSIQHAIRLAKNYQYLGSRGIVAVLDAYFPLTDSDIERYFLSIADAINVPIILYTNPNFQRANLFDRCA